MTGKMTPNGQTTVARHAGRARFTGEKEDQLSQDTKDSSRPGHLARVIARAETQGAVLCHRF
jgi:hypothetical protein